MKIITGGKVFCNGKFIDNHTIVYNKKTVSILKDEQVNKADINEEIKLNGEHVFPGFIDVHIHGKLGSDTMDATDKAIKDMSEGIVKNGVTAFLPTTMSMPKEKIQNALDNVKAFMQSENKIGAKVLGVHLEGPFINKDKKGAQPENGIFPIDEDLIINNKEVIKIISIAPEVDNAIEFISKYKEDFNFSIAHTNADYETATNAIKNGAKSFTHLFNAMTGLNHRNPGCVGSALTNDCYAEMICDNIHVNSNLYSLVKNAKGVDNLLLITDCIRAGGLAEGEYDLGGQMVTVKDGKCTLPGDVIAGSILDFNVGARNFYKATNSSFEDIAKITSLNQAKYLKMQDSIGDIKIGNFADYTILDKEFEVLYTIIDGDIAYKK